MSDHKTRDIARMMMRNHGLRAHATAQEHAAQARAKGDAAGADNWNRVARRIHELRASDSAQAAANPASATVPSTMR